MVFLGVLNVVQVRRPGAYRLPREGDALRGDRARQAGNRRVRVGGGQPVKRRFIGCGLRRGHRTSLTAQYRPHAEGDAADEEKHEQEPSHDRTQALGGSLLGLGRFRLLARVLPSGCRRGAGRLRACGDRVHLRQDGNCPVILLVRDGRGRSWGMGGEHGDGCRAGLVPVLVLKGPNRGLYPHGLEGRGGQAQRRLHVLKREGELTRRLVAPLGVLGHRDREDALELRGHVGAADGGHRGAQHAVEYGELAVVPSGNLKGGVAREDTVYGGGQGIDVDRGTEGARAVLLLRRCPRHGETARGFLARSRLRGDAEIGEDGVPELGEQDVHGLDVAVEDPALVERLHRARDAHADVEGLGHGEAVFLGTLAQVRRRAVLHDQVMAAVVRDSRGVEGHDGRVVGPGPSGSPRRRRPPRPGRWNPDAGP